MQAPSKLACIALGIPNNSCGLELANASAQCHPTAEDAARKRQGGGGAVGHVYLSKPVATKTLSVPGRMGFVSSLTWPDASDACYVAGAFYLLEHRRSGDRVSSTSAAAGPLMAPRRTQVSNGS